VKIEGGEQITPRVIRREWAQLWMSNTRLPTASAFDDAFFSARDIANKRASRPLFSVVAPVRTEGLRANLRRLAAPASRRLPDPGNGWMLAHGAYILPDPGIER